MNLENCQTEIDPEGRQSAPATTVRPIRSLPEPTLPGPSAQNYNLDDATLTLVKDEECAIGSLVVAVVSTALSSGASVVCTRVCRSTVTRTAEDHGIEGGRDADRPAGAKSPAICLGDDSVRRGGTGDLLELAMSDGSLRTTVISVSE